ncbi:hypothetical protein HYH03_013886 [Edaphochlamys debaryana]|uniref:starch synthase n=1 Tax=Edaphochlamys debaryana TaxID=47281 RepID=A0A836BU24_9CHLO|nr:hypothetical protein HYH03_013886 [Edaphochlamys debaryana]|eukprot:KAG2487464.1 hypothetical protein HYH03_013886 [Edaphochlamys debaryana]
MQLRLHAQSRVGSRRQQDRLTAAPAVVAPPRRGPSPAQFQSSAVGASADTTPAVQLTAAPGDVLVNPDVNVQVAIGQPQYAVKVLYRSRGTPLQGASSVFAHVGHSGWRDTADVTLSNAGSDGETWQGTYLVPAGRLSAPWHLETQLVFKGIVGGHERWDNNGGANWSVAVELAPAEGLVPALNPSYASTRALTSSLVLRLEALLAQRLLTPEQGSLLRVLAWQHDLGLTKAYQAVRHQDDRSVAGALAGRCSWLRPPGLNVVHVASEMAPIAKVGGLADVVASLAKAHQATGLLTEVILPKYDCIHYGEVHELRQMTELEVPWGPEPNRTVKTVVWSGCADGLPVYFIEPHSPEKYFWRGKFYGEADDAARFAFFSRAALEFLARRSHEAPDVIHCHDWQSAAVAPLLKETYKASGLARTKAVLTIHNLAFQGHVNGTFLQHMGLASRAQHVAQPDVMLHGDRPAGGITITPQGLGAQVTLNLLKGAIVYADRITTVSPTYAREVLGQALGMGLQGTLGKHQGKLTGVLNGLDYETWNPATDPCLPAHFTPDDTAGKRACKAALCGELGLPFEGQLPPASSNGNGNGSGNGHANGNGTGAATSAWGPNGRPLLAIVSRLTEQKGLPLMKAGLRAAIAAGAQVVVLGSAPEPKVHQEWEALAKELGAGGDGRIVLRHDEALSHRIFAACDMLLVPSMFEPCGLTQLIALRYGTIPIVRETGGLADTVHDVAHSRRPEHERNGFTFAAADVPAVETAIGRAIDAYRNGREWWSTQLVPRVMRQDWSWTQSAQRYSEIYQAALH